MASTSQLLTWIELECHGFTREGPRGSRALLNEAHKLLKLREAEQNVIYDAATGNLPLVTTQAGVFRYNMPDNVWRMKHLLIDPASTTDYDFQTDEDWGFETVQISGIEYRRVVNIRTNDWTRGAVAWFQFTGVDPGATTDSFLRYSFRRPTEITSDNIQHEMPGSSDVDYLMPATVALIRAINDQAKWIETRRYIKNELSPEFASEINGGEQGENTFITKRAY